MLGGREGVVAGWLVAQASADWPLSHAYRRCDAGLSPLVCVAGALSARGGSSRRRRPEGGRRRARATRQWRRGRSSRREEEEETCECPERRRCGPSMPTRKRGHRRKRSETSMSRLLLPVCPPPQVEEGEEDDGLGAVRSREEERAAVRSLARDGVQGMQVGRARRAEGREGGRG